MADPWTQARESMEDQQMLAERTRAQESMEEPPMLELTPAQESMEDQQMLVQLTLARGRTEAWATLACRAAGSALPASCATRTNGVARQAVRRSRARSASAASV